MRLCGLGWSTEGTGHEPAHTRKSYLRLWGSYLKAIQELNPSHLAPYWSRAEAQRKGDGHRVGPAWQQCWMPGKNRATSGSMPHWLWTRLPGSQPCCWLAKWPWPLGFRVPSIKQGLNWFQSAAIPVPSNLAWWVTFLGLPQSSSEYTMPEQDYPTVLGCQHRAQNSATCQQGKRAWRRKWKGLKGQGFHTQLCEF